MSKRENGPYDLCFETINGELFIALFTQRIAAVAAAIRGNMNNTNPHLTTHYRFIVRDSDDNEVDLTP